MWQRALVRALQASARLKVDGVERRSYSSTVRRVALRPTHTCKVRRGTAGAMQRRWLLLAIWCAASEGTSVSSKPGSVCVCACLIPHPPT